MNLPMREDNIPRSITIIDQHNNKLELTEDNLRLLKECSSEGFRNRALPMGLSFGFLSYVIMKRSGLNLSNFSSVPIVVFTSIAGMVVGLRSYSDICRKRLMNAIKQNPQSVTEYPNYPLQKDHETFIQSKPTDIEVPIMSDLDSMSDNRNIDIQRLPETHTPDTPQHYTTYDELRESNRREYYEKVIKSGHGGQSNYNPLQPGYPQTQPWHFPAAQFGNSRQHPAAGTQPEYTQQPASRSRDRVPVQPANPEMTSPQGFNRNSQQKNEYGDDW